MTQRKVTSLDITGYENVNNTSDINKPISNATQIALDGKTDVGHTHSTSSIIGLQSELDGKTNVGHTHSQSDVVGLTSSLFTINSDIGDIQAALLLILGV